MQNTPTWQDLMITSARRSLKLYLATKNHPMSAAEFRAHMERNYLPEIVRAAFVAASGLRPVPATNLKHAMGKVG